MYVTDTENVVLYTCIIFTWTDLKLDLEWKYIKKGK